MIFSSSGGEAWSEFDEVTGSEEAAALILVPGNPSQSVTNSISQSFPCANLSEAISIRKVIPVIQIQTYLTIITRAA
jgi:hypothetical protein